MCADRFQGAIRSATIHHALVCRNTMARRRTAIRSAYSTRIVSVTKRASEIIVLTLVPDRVAFKLSAVLQITSQFARALAVTLETHSPTVIRCSKMKFRKINANPIRARTMRSATLAFAHVCLAYKAIHTHCVGQNAF